MEKHFKTGPFLCATRCLLQQKELHGSPFTRAKLAKILYISSTVMLVMAMVMQSAADDFRMFQTCPKLVVSFIFEELAGLFFFFFLILFLWCFGKWCNYSPPTLSCQQKWNKKVWRKRKLLVDFVFFSSSFLLKIGCKRTSALLVTSYMAVVLTSYVFVRNNWGDCGYISYTMILKGLQLINPMPFFQQTIFANHVCHPLSLQS